MYLHSKRVTTAVTPEVAAIYESLASATGRTLSSVVSDVLISRKVEVAHFLDWLDRQPAGSGPHKYAVDAAWRLARVSLIDAIRGIEPGYRTPEEQELERREQGEALLRVIETARGGSILAPAQLAERLQVAKEQVAHRHARHRESRKREREALSISYAGSIHGAER